MESYDDFFDLPDESATADNNLLNNSLFSNSKNNSLSKTITVDNILKKLPKSSQINTTKKSIVTFQNQALDVNQQKKNQESVASKLSNSIVTKKNSGFTPNFESVIDSAHNITTSTMNQSSSSLLDSLFSSPKQTTSNILSSIDTTSSRQKVTNATEQKQSVESFSQSMAPNETNTAFFESIISSKDREIDELRRELSTIRYEKAEDQKTIANMRQKIENLNFESQRQINELNEKQRKEIFELNKKNEADLEELKHSSVKQQEILNNLKEQENISLKVKNRVEILNDTLSDIQSRFNDINNQKEDVDKILKFAQQQISYNLEQFENEKIEWKKSREIYIKNFESELNEMKTNYENEIIHGRQWAEEERERLHVERLAFQEEQITIINFIEQKQNELDVFKNDFLSKEHDLLIRVVNEKTILEQQRQDFERQRASDVARLRNEAEHLEKCLIQVDNARNALTNAHFEYEKKNQQLNEIKGMLIEYEQKRWKK